MDNRPPTAKFWRTLDVVTRTAGAITALGVIVAFLTTTTAFLTGTLDALRPGFTTRELVAHKEKDTAGRVAATDGIVTAWVRTYNQGDHTVYLLGEVSKSGPEDVTDTLAGTSCNPDSNSGVPRTSISFPVKKGERWRVSVKDGTTADLYVYWTPWRWW